MSLLITVVVGSATISSLIVCIKSIYERGTQKSAYFNLLTMAVSCYMIGNFLEFISVTKEASVAGVKVAHLGIAFVPPLWYLCVREFCGSKIKNSLVVLGMMIIPFCIVFLAFTWEYNHLLFLNFWYESSNHLSQLRFSDGPFYIVKQFYLYLFSALGMVTICEKYYSGSKKVKSQFFLFIISALIPLFNTTTYLVNIDSYLVDITPIALAYSMVLFYIALRMYGVQNFLEILKSNIIENLHEGIILFDRDGYYMDSNKVAQDIFPQIKNAMVGTDLNEMKSMPFDNSSLSKKDGEIIEFSKKYGEMIRTYSVSVSHIKLNDKVTGHSLVIYNITPIKNLMTELELKAYMDPLTGIYNRGYFFEKSLYEIDRAKLAKNNLSFIIFDLDFFKIINDNYGHPCGDYVLRTIAQISTQNLRKTDILGRYGGEEFCILLINTDLEGARLKAETLREKIAAHVFEYDKNIFNVTASFGVSILNNEITDDAVDLILRRADDNLYKAKTDGRNRVAI